MTKNIYDKEAIKQLTLLIQGDNAARAWLQNNHYPELILFHYAIDGNDEALKELTNKKSIDLVAFAHAILDDKRAFNWLAENKKFILAATVKVTYNDKNAEAWLIKNNLLHFAELGNAIRKNEKDQSADDIFGVMKSFFKFLLNPLKRQAKW